MNTQTGLSRPDTDRKDPRPLSLVGVPPGEPLGSPGLIGRESELLALHGFMNEAAAHGAAQVVYGHAGSGKTAVLEAVVQAATTAGTRVLRCAGARGSDPSGSSGVLQLVWPLLRGPGRSPAAIRLAAMEMLMVDGVSVPNGQGRLSFAVLDVLESLSAEQPLLVAVDDWDALDEPSRNVLTFVARRTGGRPLGLLMTTRPHRTPPSSLTGLPELRLGPLTSDQSARLLATRRPGLDAQAVHELLTTAAGNPLALLELPARYEDPLPWAPTSSDRLASAMAPGVARLPQETRDLLLVSALHPAGDLPLLLSAAARIGGSELGFATLEPAEREGIVVFDGMRVLFSHPATPGAVVHDVDPQRIRAAHAGLAAELTSGSVQMLWHLSQAVEGHDPQLATRLEAARHHALEQCGAPMAVRLLRRSADLYLLPDDRGRSALRAAQLAHSLGFERMARTMAHRALQHTLGPLGTICAQTLTRTGDDSTQPPPDPALWPAPVDATERENALELVRTTAPAVVGDEARAQALLTFIDGMPEQAHDPRLLHAMATVRPALRAATVLAGVSAVQHLTNLPVHDLERLGEAALLAGDPLRALELFRQAERRHRIQELPEQLPRVLLQQGMAHLATGDWSQAGHAFRRCAGHAEEHGQGRHAAAARLLEALVHGMRTGGAVRPADPLLLDAARRSVPMIEAILAVGTACAQVEGGDFGAGYRALSSLLSAPGTRAVALVALASFAEAARAENVSEEALATLDELEAELGIECAPVVGVRLAVARAVLADERYAEPLFARAYAEDLARRPFVEASLRLAHGRWLRRRRRLAESRTTLRQAAATFGMMGAEARATWMAEELRASGERANGSVPGAARPGSVRDLLTAQELRIADLAARGLSNREIGELLVLSPRTIGAYLYRIFPRLGVTGRAQLADVLKHHRLP
ncbi:transcriptional regulator [Streptomyces dioscori]|uniref:Transcriptional regulator n=1 Tax=Streptomyces dioscori TaxID=2109333 RepID=A0A2P8Q9P9_9ACTN|nr:LuxR family transcriptional regulator [Streptomyces dioscori]PSM42948.1 transcriptional regulator [Streptomyces dioscori]